MTAVAEEPAVIRTSEAALLELRQLIVDYGSGPKRVRAKIGRAHV